MPRAQLEHGQPVADRLATAIPASRRRRGRPGRTPAATQFRHRRPRSRPRRGRAGRRCPARDGWRQSRHLRHERRLCHRTQDASWPRSAGRGRSLLLVVALQERHPGVVVRPVEQQLRRVRLPVVLGQRDVRARPGRRRSGPACRAARRTSPCAVTSKFVSQVAITGPVSRLTSVVTNTTQVFAAHARPAPSSARCRCRPSSSGRRPGSGCSRSTAASGARGRGRERERLARWCRSA